MKSKKKKTVNQPFQSYLCNTFVRQKKVSSFFHILWKNFYFLINFQFINNKLHDLFMYLLATRLFNFYCLGKQLCNCKIYTTVMALKCLQTQVYIQLAAQTVLTSIQLPIFYAFTLHTSVRHIYTFLQLVQILLFSQKTLRF